MGRIGVFIERYTITRSEEMGALMHFSQVARKLGHEIDYLFRPDIHKIPNYDALFIRALTDPLNSSYIAARVAEMHGKRVVDDPESIFICCDKVNMYNHLNRNNVPIPRTVILNEADLNEKRGRELLNQISNPLVLKAPNSSFSLYVDRVKSAEEFVRVGTRFLRRSDRFLAQEFVKSEFDWRVGLIGGEVIYVCQYTIPKKQWKIVTYTESGSTILGPVRAVDIEKADPALIDVAKRAAAAVGTGLYGVDLKQVGDTYIVIEVNDNPTIGSGEEDRKAPGLYEKIIRYLMPEGNNGQKN